MRISISDLKQHAETFVHNLGVGAEHEMAKAIAAFTQFVEGKQAEADAVALLQAHGYTVTAPPTASV